MGELRFEMSGRKFTWDGDREISADELWALDAMGVSELELLALMDASRDDVSMPRKVRAACALAYLCARREDPSVEWREFSKTIHPGTMRLITDEPPAEKPPRRTSRVGKALAAEQVEEPKAAESAPA